MFFVDLYHHIAPKSLELLRHKNANCALVAATPQPPCCDDCDPLESAGPDGATTAGLATGCRLQYLMSKREKNQMFRAQTLTNPKSNNLMAYVFLRKI